MNGDIKLTKNILSSTHFNFLFGSGVNGKVFPQFNGFKRTIDFISEKLGKTVVNLEESLDELTGNVKDEAKEIFEEEFKENEKSVDWNNNSIKNIKKLFLKVAQIVEKTENRVALMNQINIFTLNYDEIVEKSIREIGYTTNVISPINIDVTSRYYNCYETDYSKNRFVPMFNVSKIHGEKDIKVLPGIEKFKQGFSTKIFQLLFEMKSVLERYNSSLFVVGYSGNDKDVNPLLIDCLKNGLTIIWVCFNQKDEENVKQLFNNVENGDTIIYITGDGSKDGTQLLYEEFNRIVGDNQDGNDDSSN